MKICRVCKQPNADLYCPSYWGQKNKYHYHKSCFQSEAIELQTIDANCNDCKHYEREKNCSIEGTSVKWSIGTCADTGERVTGTVNFCQSNPCFEHRKS